MSQTMAGTVRILADAGEAQQRVLTPDALDFVAMLHRRFDATRETLLRARIARQEVIAGGVRPDFLIETRSVREGDWRVAPAPADLNDRRVEITGPVERKMMINALNSGAKVFMADFEDALSPTWANVVSGQCNCMDAIRGTIAFTSTEGKRYALGNAPATLVVRPRGWHLVERHLTVDGVPVSASLFDFGLYFFHNARELVARGSGPYFYLPKMESHLEARLWNEVFVAAQQALGTPRGTIRATVLIETILAAFEMEEILYELRDHAAGLNAGRWDYLFSAIKKFGATGPIFPDRAQLTMTIPFMRAYTELLVKTCHRRGAHAIGGMAAFIPSRRDAAVNETALARVREDKLRESRDGFDGTWVAHPDLVPVAAAVFDEVLGARPHQKERTRGEVEVRAAQLTDFAVPGGTVSEAGVRANIDVALQYIEAWLRGSGAVAIHNLMEDAATAEISRSQLWQWLQREAPLSDGTTIDRDRYVTLRGETLASLKLERGDAESRLDDAAALLDRLVLDEIFTDFLTVPGYELLDGARR
jgi:malate synthase